MAGSPCAKVPSTLRGEDSEGEAAWLLLAPPSPPLRLITSAAAAGTGEPATATEVMSLRGCEVDISSSQAASRLANAYVSLISPRAHHACCSSRLTVTCPCCRPGLLYNTFAKLMRW